MKEKALVLSLKQPHKNLNAEESLFAYERAKRDPAFFLKGMLGTNLWRKQEEIFRSVFNYDRVVVKACHASGKSFCAAATVLTYVHTNIPCVVVTTAPTWRQVSVILWKEIHRIYNRAKRPLGGNLLQTSYSLFDDTFAMGMATEDPEKFQGVHSENILVVVDEAPGVDEEIFDAIEGIMASGKAKMLLLGNPSNLEGAFYRAFHDPAYSKLFKKMTISAFDTPNVQQGYDVVPGLVTRRWVEERKEIWGENHPLYQIKVLGEFPGKEFGDLVVPPVLVERGKCIVLPPKYGDIAILGVDVAELGGDETAVAVRKGGRLKSVMGWVDAELPITIQRILDIAIREDAAEIRIDRIGVGAGVYARLKELEAEQTKWRVIGIDVREKPIHLDKYPSARDEMWYEFREMLRRDEVDLSEFSLTRQADITLGQLMNPKFKILPNTGLIKVEAKPEMRGRGLDSPDRADAVIMAYYDDYKAKEPITRLAEAHQIASLAKTSDFKGWSSDWSDPPWRDRE